MPFCRLFYHVVWATKNRQWLLDGAVEARVHALLRASAINLGGHVYALDGMADHVHMVTTIPASIAVATFIGRVKGRAASLFNKESEGLTIAWQEEYSAFSFDGSRLPQYIGYVEKQKQHHGASTTIPLLEPRPPLKQGASEGAPRERGLGREYPSKPDSSGASP